MKIYGILVRFSDMATNINEAFKTYESAAKAILNKIRPSNLHAVDKYNIIDLSNNIHYEIKEIYLEEE